MNENVGRFSIPEFIGYLFPGLITLGGIYMFLSLPILNLDSLGFDWPFGDIVTVLLISAFAYMIGLIQSGISKPIADMFIKAFRLEQPRNQLPSELYRDEIVNALHFIYGIKKSKLLDGGWRSEVFYLCRSAVLECVPTSGHLAERAGIIRQLRRNLTVSVFVLAISGIAWGLWFFYHTARVTGTLIIILTILVWIFTTIVYLKSMVDNANREAREIYTSFLTGYRTGLIKPTTKRTVRRSN